MNDSNNDQIDELLNELEILKDELDHNQLEQDYLRSTERDLERQLKKVQDQLDYLEVEYD